MRPRLLLTLLLPALGACDSGPMVPEDGCTLRASLDLRVLDSAGAPVSGVSAHDSLPRTGAVLPVQELPGAPGTYEVLSDENRAGLRAAGDTLLILGASGPDSFTLRWVVDIVQGCHVHLKSGADSVVVP